MQNIDYIKLSKFISFLLRHKAKEYNLEVDTNGYVALEKLLYVIKQNPKFANVNEDIIKESVYNSPKKRFELSGNYIRARYGHSFSQKINYLSTEPPIYLYHGTSKVAWNNITIEGLQPMRRQYVHLSTNIEQARLVGERHTNNPIILQIQAKIAYDNGISFYLVGEDIFLSSYIPMKYIKKV